MSVNEEATHCAFYLGASLLQAKDAHEIILDFVEGIQQPLSHTLCC